MRALFASLAVAALVACAGSPRSETPTASTRQETGDVVRLKSGESISGRIVSVDAHDLSIESNGRVRVFPKRDVAEVSSSRTEVAVSPTETVRTSIPPSTWYPRRHSRDPILQVEVTFFEPHPLGGEGSCLGDLAKALEETPEVTLFADAGGKIRLNDTRKWGYHAHLFPGDLVRKPVDRPGLVLDVRADAPQTVAFVSPAQEMKAADGSPRSSYALPDALVARVRDLGAADSTLAAQPFAGRPRETRLGSLWAFALPRSDRQFLLFLADPRKKHGKVLEEAYAAYGDAVLAPDLLVDVVAADGVMVGRVFVLPMPEGLSADGPAPEPISVLSGRDGHVVTSVPVPPRAAVMLPARAPATRADVHLSCFETSKAVSERLLVAHGTGRPTSGATVTSRPLTPEKSDETVRIDLSSLPAERFPAVAWFTYRRSYLWRDGGFLGEPAPSVLPRGGGGAPTKVITNTGRLPHVTPILFVGPDPRGGSSESLLDSPVVGGMSNALMSDALAREAGTAFQSLSTLSNLVPRDGGERPTTHERGGSDANAQSVTNVYITIPPHTSTPAVGDLVGGTQPSGTQYPRGRWPLQGSGYTDYYTGQKVGTWTPGGRKPMDRGGATYDPKTGEAKEIDMSSWERGEMQFDSTGTPILTFRKRRHSP